jgi:hypothetical protein
MNAANPATWRGEPDTRGVVSTTTETGPLISATHAQRGRGQRRCSLKSLEGH